jgi:peptidoglycan/LPS O-acetylase OafA/YrhL
MHAEQRGNNFNALRLFAAMLVLVGHAYVFLGLPEPLFLGRLSLGMLGVQIFFAISGYLVSQSWERDPHLIRFFQRRALRIFPGLIVVLLLSVLVLGPALTTLPVREYFAHDATWGYFSNAYLYMTYLLPGVFEQLRVPYAVNGSLWSLPIEFFLYVLLAGLGLWHRPYLFVLAALASALGCLLWALPSQEMLVIYRTDARQIVLVGVFFWVGVLLQRYRCERFFSLTGFALTTTALVIAARYPQAFTAVSWLAIPYLALSFGLASNAWLIRLTRSGDYSYGVYIYAFPVQQSLVYLYPGISITSYILSATAITLLFAAASWHWIETRALDFKPKTPARASAQHAASAA